MNITTHREAEATPFEAPTESSQRSLRTQDYSFQTTRQIWSRRRWAGVSAIAAALLLALLVDGITLPPGRAEGVSVGAELSLWDPSLADWLVWMRREHPEIAVRADVDSPSRLLDKLQDGFLDVGVLHNPPQQPELVVELLCEEKLVMVTTSADAKLNTDDYVFVDWGPAFAANHQAAFAEPINPPVSISLGPLARTYLLAVGGAGYFRLGSVEPYLSDGRLRRVIGAPEFSHSVYLVYSARRERTLIDLVRGGLRDCFTKR
jgi:LysR family transcriptional regulator, flagellar master operon regulator